MRLVLRVLEETEPHMENKASPRGSKPSSYSLHHANLPPGGTSKDPGRAPYAHPQRFITLAETLAHRLPKETQAEFVNSLLRRWGVR